MIRAPRLAQGKGYRRPEFWGCCNTGTTPSIFHTQHDRYVVGPETYCRDAMQNGKKINKVEMLAEICRGNVSLLWPARLQTVTVARKSAPLTCAKQSIIGHSSATTGHFRKLVTPGGFCLTLGVLCCMIQV